MTTSLRHLQLLASALLLAGCPSTRPSNCPACPAGTLCDELAAACVPVGVPDDGGAPDLATTSGCNPKCSGLTPLCNPAKKCVGCVADTDCPMNTFCKVVSDSVASCVAGCNDDKRCGGGKCCGNRCVDTSSDATSCGACGTVCSGAHAKAACTAGKCVPGKCDSGWGDCNGNGADGCETNLHVDARNCTACGNVCKIPNALAACADGCYAAACQWGFDDCNQDPMDGCETSVLMDGLNCGACGKGCAKLPNAMAGCMNGSCVLGACSPGYFDCDRDARNGCEASLLSDSKNCNGCGNVCPMNAPACANGKCGNLFTFMGIQQNLKVAALGGWSQCYLDTYDNSQTPIADILKNCGGSYLLLACRPKGADTLTLAAMAPRADVIFDTGQGNVLHAANGVGWYFSDSFSWGFVPDGEPVSRNSCDTGNTQPDKRMCWHSGGGRINSGYRCGSQFLNGSNAWERLIYHAMP